MCFAMRYFTSFADYTQSGFIKFIECAFVVTAIYNIYNTLFLQSFGAVLPDGFGLINPVITIFGLIFCIVYPVYWQRRENKGRIDSKRRHLQFQAIIRYWLAASLCTYGFAKLFKTQFVLSYAHSDSLVRDLSGYDLTWVYFGHSFALSAIIGIMQIVGAILLLFRGTTLLGAVLLFPVLVNILLINWFFSITAYALLNSILYTLGLLYILLLHAKQILTFLNMSDPVPPQTTVGFVKNAIRLLAVICPLAVVYYITTLRSPKTIVGKWRVDSLRQTSGNQNARKELTCPLNWKNIYLEDYGQVVFSSNAYFVEKDKVFRGFYRFNAADTSIQLILSKRSNINDTFGVKATISNQQLMKWRVVIYSDTLLLWLSRPGSE